MNTVEEVKRRIEAAFPGARVEVSAYSGEDHLRARVAAPQFSGKSRIEQHRLIYASLAELMGGAIHALQLETRATGVDE